MKNLINQIKNQLSEIHGDSHTTISWKDQEGILISVDNAQKVLEMHEALQKVYDAYGDPKIRDMIEELLKEIS